MIPHIDIGTLYVSAAIVAAFFGFAFLAFHLIDSDTRGILHWGIAYLAIATGLTITLLRAGLPLLVYGPIASSLFIGAASLLDAGTRMSDEPRIRVLDAVIPVIAVALLVFFSYVVPNLAVRLEVTFLSVAILTARTSLRLIGRARESEDGTRTALITFSLFYSVLAVSLIVLFLIAAIVGPFLGVFDRHPVPAVLVPALMLFLIGAGMSKLWVHYMHAYVEARRAATTDPLTGVRNRGHVMPELERLFQRSKRERRMLACLMLDADRFKAINDTHGHRVGDEVLQHLARRIVEAVREYDLVGRYGGEEFIVVVPEHERDDVLGMARRIHESIRDAPLAGFPLTVSVGVAFLRDEDTRADDLIHRADEALYRAKRAGRDRIVVDEPHVGPHLVPGQP